MMLLANPRLEAKTVFTSVETASSPHDSCGVGLDPHSLQSVQMEGTLVLPGTSFGGENQQ